MPVGAWDLIVAIDLHGPANLEAWSSSHKLMTGHAILTPLLAVIVMIAGDFLAPGVPVEC